MEMAGKHVCPQTLSLTGRFGEPQGGLQIPPPPPSPGLFCGGFCGGMVPLFMPATRIVIRL